MSKTITPSEIAAYFDKMKNGKYGAWATKAAATIRELEASLRDAEGDMNVARYELDQVSAASGTVRFMDPPDGGSVTLAQQVARMHDALNAAEAKLKIATEALGQIEFADGEINPSNYDHDDACALNDSFVECVLGARKALARIKEVG